MSQHPPRGPCARPGCSNTARLKSGLCSEHEPREQESERTKPKAKHTPTPWKAVPPMNQIHSADGMFIAEIRGWGHLTGRGGGLGLSDDEARAIQDANGEFIVRAANCHEEMLAKLKEIHAVWSAQGSGLDYHRACFRLTELIAKAEGR